MYCQPCGQEVKPGAVFCPSCGENREGGNVSRGATLLPQAAITAWGLLAQARRQGRRLSIHQNGVTSTDTMRSAVGGWKARYRDVQHH